MAFALVPAGRFQMGSPRDEKHRGGDEHQHEVTITRPFYLGVYEVTQEQYQKVMGSNPSHFSATGLGRQAVQGLDTRSFPVEQVNWEEACEFCRRLSALPAEKAAGRAYRLPTEAEWERACRGGAKAYAPFHLGKSLSATQANFIGTEPYGGGAVGPYLKRTAKVGSYKPNAFGLYDLHGNVWEWCAGWYGKDAYREKARRDPQGPASGKDRLARGGGWGSSGQVCRSAFRGHTTPDSRASSIGFRALCVPAAR
jgi:formylglycine-generating enzyme required for sulfatase activity